MAAPIVSASGWMTESFDQIGPKALRAIAVPGAHDSGTSIFTTSTIGSGVCNTQTQSLNILEQLNAGVRYFDFRPVTWSGIDDFYHGHFSEKVDAYWGSACQSLSSALEQLAQFVQQPGSDNEVVVFKLSHFLQLVTMPIPELTVVAGGPFRELDFQNLVTAVVNDIGHLLFTSSDAGISLNDTSLAEITSGSGRIIVVFDLTGGSSWGLPASMVDPSRGVFSYNDVGNGTANLVVYDNYSDSADLNGMVADQQQKFSTFVPSAGNSFLLSWTLTESNPFGTCISELAATANPALDQALETWVAEGIIRSDKIPNVVYTDFVDDPSVALAAAMYLNYLS